MGIHSPATVEGVGYADIRIALEEAGWIYDGVIIWHKTNSGFSNHQTVCNSSESVWLYRQQGSRVRPLGAYHNVVSAPVQRNPSQPFEKPLELCQRVIEACVPEGHVVSDPFSGSGSYGVAAVRVGRLCYGSEMVPEYAATANGRIQQELAQRNRTAG